MADEPLAGPGMPFIVELKAGEYWLCRCGHTKKPPLCDNTHLSGADQPRRIELAENTALVLCGCGKTANRPYCDCSHGKLPVK